MPVSGLTLAQLRILEYCGIDWRWISLKELDEALPPDDIVVVPSLVERRLLEHRAGLRTVRITQAGMVLAWTR